MDNYDFKTAENKWLKFWDKEQIYKFDPKSKKKIYSIDTPPPTVSGKMHIGHAFSYSQGDFIARYHRMKGENVFYPFGTDDNGLPTERLVEKLKNVKGSKMDRTEFIKLCLKTLQEIKPGFIQDWKNIGVSADFNVFYSTIDDHCRKISQKSFIDLYKDGREYQKEAPTIWCPQCETAIAQVELEDKEIESSFNDIIFKLENGKDLIIGTTRPELLGSCVAIFVHPDDKRYKNLIGKKAKIPLFNKEVPILTDEKADPEKGTGAVMCCTFGDKTDAEWYKIHKLPLIISISRNGKMTENAGKYSGLNIKEARIKIIEDLKENKLLVSQKKIIHPVNVHERCGTEIEILNSKQWYVKYLDLKNKFIESGKKLNFYPEHMFNRYENWVKGLQWDWCVSRQRFFGVPFPVWYCKKCGEIILAEEKQLPVDPLKDKPLKKCKCGYNEFEADKDVLDTWATSSLTPQIAASLFPSLYKKLYPMNLRPQAHDIISFWLFNTLVKSQLHNGFNPWNDVVISGWALDQHGKKMSKSKGNVVEPQAVLDKYGADALRFWAASSKLGDDLPYQEKELVSGQRTVNKLWNASKFCFMHLEEYKGEVPKKLNATDRWLLSKLNNLIKTCTDSFEVYEYSRVKANTELFFWKTFCDNYLEIVKDRLYNPDRRGKENRLSGQYTLNYTLITILKLFAPIMPFITEEIYQNYYKKNLKKSSIHLLEWPESNKKLIDNKIEELGDKVVEAISYVRKEKAMKGKSLKEPVKILILSKDLKEFEDDIKAVTQADKIEYGKETKLSL